MAESSSEQSRTADGEDGVYGGGKPMPIGAVCKTLSQEFPEISISKIRYLEDQKLVEPRRTAGGYRLYSARDVERLRAILRMQRDEFLPLRVIRQELVAGRLDGGPSEVIAAGEADPASARSRRRPSVVENQSGARYKLADVLGETRTDEYFIAELSDFGVIEGQVIDGVMTYDETEMEIIRAAAELARFGVGGRNLRVFRTSADREATLLRQILAPALRSRNEQRRAEALEALENLAAVTTHLKHLLLVQDLRRMLG